MIYSRKHEGMICSIEEAKLFDKAKIIYNKCTGFDKGCAVCDFYINEKCDVKTDFKPYFYTKIEFIKEYVGAKNETLDI